MRPCRKQPLQRPVHSHILSVFSMLTKNHHRMVWHVSRISIGSHNVIFRIFGNHNVIFRISIGSHNVIFRISIGSRNVIFRISIGSRNVIFRISIGSHNVIFRISIGSHNVIFRISIGSHNAKVIDNSQLVTQALESRKRNCCTVQPACVRLAVSDAMHILGMHKAIPQGHSGRSSCARVA